jgi:phosphoserine phosphatase RsbU/P
MRPRRGPLVTLHMADPSPPPHSAPHSPPSASAPPAASPQGRSGKANGAPAPATSSEDAARSPVVITHLSGIMDLGDSGAVSLRDFLTDGSLIAACDELCRTTGLPIWLRDRTGAAIVLSESGGLWDTVPDDRAAVRAAALAGVPHDPNASLFTAPLRTSAGELGSFVIAAPPTRDVDGAATPASEASLRRALTRLATAISEGCEAQLSLRQRVMELGALYRLSSLVVETEDVDQLLSVALELAIDVLRADAGSIGLIEDERDELVIKATRNLSKEWVAYSAKLSHGGLLRQAALRGEIVCVEDLTTDEASVDPERVRSERLCSLFSTGLMYQGRAIGLIRLYSRVPRWFTLAERGLLRSIADQSAAAVNNARLRALREQDERVRRQMRLAADVQRRMLPRVSPDLPKLDVAARYVPSFELGGDFYDFLHLGPNLGLVVGDVVGKGIAAALLMSAVRASLRAHAQDVYDLDEVIARVNAALVADTRDNEFATLWYGIIDPATMDITYCNAGHNPPILFRAGAAPVELDSGGMALGIDAAQRYDRGSVRLQPGDCLIAYTDGLTDAANFENQRFGKVRLHAAVQEALAKCGDVTAAEILEHVFWHLRQFVGLNAASDDLTLVVTRARP